MASPERQDPIFAIIEHDTTAPVYLPSPDGSIEIVGYGQTTAKFEWPIAKPTDTYTIPLGKFVSVEFDSHFPLRPSSLTVQDRDRTGTENVLLEYFGVHMADAIEAARKQGIVTVRLALADKQLINLRSLQLESPSTPKLLRRACASIDLGGVVEFDRSA